MPSGGQVSGLFLYDTRTRGFSTVTDLASPGGLGDYRPEDFAVDDRTVVWDASGTDANGTAVTEVAAADLRGGHVRRLAVVRGGTQMLEVTVVDHRWLVYTGDHGVYRIPLSGNRKPELVRGSDGLHLAVWPWAGNVFRGAGGAPRTAVPRNLETGGTRTFGAPGVSGMMDRCVGNGGMGDMAAGDGRPELTHHACVIAWPDPDHAGQLLVFDAAAVR